MSKIGRVYLHVVCMILNVFVLVDMRVFMIIAFIDHSIGVSYVSRMIFGAFVD